MIVLAPDTRAVDLHELGSCACVVAPGYEPPRLAPGAWVASVAEYLSSPDGVIGEHSTLVVVGLQRMLTPSNRTQLGPHLLRPRPGVRRVSVDRTLFLVEPWRAWWHFGCVGARYREYTYSYLAESHWRAAQDGMREDPFSLDMITAAGRGVIRSLAPVYFEPLRVRTIALSAGEHREYAELKARAFDEEHTASKIIARLSGFAQERCPGRRVLTPARLFAGPSHPPVVATDLGVDAWLVGRLRALVELTNGIAKTFHVEAAA